LTRIYRKLKTSMRDLLKNQTISPRLGRSALNYDSLKPAAQESSRSVHTHKILLKKQSFFFIIPAILALTALSLVLLQFAKPQIDSASSAPEELLVQSPGYAYFEDQPALAETTDQDKTAALGAGMNNPDRQKDFIHEVQEGQSLSEIAWMYKIDTEKLAALNDIQNPNRLRAGQKITIPSLEHEKNFVVPQKTIAKKTAVSSKNLSSKKVEKISFEYQTNFDGQSITGHFSLPESSQVSYSYIEWNLGDGNKSFRPDLSWTYEKPGTYAVSLKARDSLGNNYEAAPVYLEVPDPAVIEKANRSFMNLNDPASALILEEPIYLVNGKESELPQYFEQLDSDDGLFHYQVKKAGYYDLRLGNEESSREVFLFVSPEPSVLVENESLNWYRTQFNTGTLSNCGPSTVSMALAWAKNIYYPVSAIRQQIGWQGDGGTSFKELRSILNQESVNNTVSTLRKPEDLRAILDAGKIAIVLIQTSKIRRAKGTGLSSMYDRYYNDSVGHYIVVKGYTLDGNHFIINDPIPSDWSSNSFRQADGISMAGKNRFYASTDLFGALKTREAIVISR